MGITQKLVSAASGAVWPRGHVGGELGATAHRLLWVTASAVATGPAPAAGGGCPTTGLIPIVDHSALDDVPADTMLEAGSTGVVRASTAEAARTIACACDVTVGAWRGALGGPGWRGVGLPRTHATAGCDRFRQGHTSCGKRSQGTEHRGAGVAHELAPVEGAREVLAKQSYLVF